jgi:elongation factor Ts
MSVSAEQIKLLRQETGAGVLDCRTALEEAGGDLDKAKELLLARGLALAEARAERATAEGLVEVYSHGEGRLGVMIEVNCETDFVARSEPFRRFVHEMALQVAAGAPRWVRPEDVPAEALEAERAQARQLAQAEGKPEQVIERIVQGKLEKFLDEACLTRQVYVRDEDKKIAEVLQEVVLSTHENIQIRRFQRWEVGEQLG